ncbi:MAG: hypothetical protein ACR2JV_01165, partial [Gaiellales bacterium]
PLGDRTPPGQLAGSPVVVRVASLLISASPSPVRIVSPAGEATLPAYGGLLVGTLGLPAWALAIAPAAEGTALAAPLALDPALVFAGPVAMGTGRTLVGSETSASSVAAGAVYFDIRDALTAGRVSPRLVIDATVRTPGSAPFGATLYAHDGSGGAAQISTAAAGSIAAAGGVADLAVRDAAVTGRVTATSSALTLRGLPTMPAAVRTALALKSTARLAITLPLDGTTTAYALAFGAPDGPRVADVFGKGDVLARGGVVSIDARAGGASGPLAVTLDSELLGEPVAMNGTIDVNAGSASLQARRVSVRLGPAVFKWTDVDATTTAGTPDFAVAVDGWLEFLDDLTEMRGTIVRDRSTSSLAYTARLRGTAPDASILAEPVPLTGGGNMNLDVRGVVDGNGFSVRHARAEFKSSLKILGKTKTDMDFVVGFSRYGLVDTLLLNTQYEAKFSYGSAAGQATVGMERFLPKGVFMGAIALNGVPLQWWFGSFDGPLKSATIGTARYSSYGRNLGVVDFRVTVKYRLTTTIGVATFAANAHGSADAEVDVYGCFWRGGWCGWTGIGAELGFGFNPYSVKVGVKLPVLGRKTLSF